MYDVINMPDLVSRYFSSNLWLDAFIVSVIYLFFRLNSAGKRAIFATVVAFFLVINVFVIRLFTALNENDTFYRHLWAIPSTTIIGIAIVDLVRIIPRWFLKIPAIAVIAIFLYFANQEYIRCREHYFSTDAKMVTEDAITIADELEKLRKESGKNTLFVVCPIGYGNQYGNYINELNLYSGFLTISDSSFLNDENHNGEEELTGENPNVEFIMSKCCASGIDYVVVGKKEKTEVIYESFGYNPEMVGDSHILYKCSGYAGYRQDVNQWNQVVYRAYYDKNGDPTEGITGYAKVRFTYDNKAREIRRAYYGTNDEPCLTAKGYASVENTYYSNGLLKSVKHLGTDNRPVYIEGRFETRYEYDGQKRIVKESYYDEQGLLANRTDEGYAIKELEYDQKGNLTRERFLNQLEHRCLINGLYSERIRTYTENGRIASVQYLDENGEVKNLLGRYLTKYEYNASGKKVRESYCDKDGQLMNRTGDYYAIKEYVYDLNNRVIKESYYDINYQPIKTNAGFSALERIYIEDSLSGIIYYDKDMSILSMCGNEANSNATGFPHLSDSTSINTDGDIEFVTLVPDNSFNIVYMILYDMKTGKDVITLISTRESGEYSGTYEQQLPDGLYYLSLRANGRHSDESMGIYMYIKENGKIGYRFNIDTFDPKEILISSLSLDVKQSD